MLASTIGQWLCQNHCHQSLKRRDLTQMVQVLVNTTPLPSSNIHTCSKQTTFILRTDGIAHLSTTIHNAQENCRLYTCGEHVLKLHHSLLQHNTTVTIDWTGFERNCPLLRGSNLAAETVKSIAKMGTKFLRGILWNKVICSLTGAVKIGYSTSITVGRIAWSKGALTNIERLKLSPFWMNWHIQCCHRHLLV